MRNLQRLVGGLALAVVATAAAGPWKDLADQLLTESAKPAAASLSDADIGAGLREALAKGTKAAVTQLGRADGFWGDTRFRIPLPKPLARSEKLVRSFGGGEKLDAVHLAMNRAAEEAVPLAADVFSEAVRKLTLDDVRAILTGPQDSATQYFKRTTTDTLLEKFKPVVAQVTGKLGLVQRYNAVLSSAGPLAASLGAPDLDDYVARKALDGLFTRVADEEKDIRENPLARTSDLLKRVFGS